MESLSPLRKIVSGGQTGVDRAALDVALHLEIEHGGWCPKGRRSEDGAIPAVYQLRETVERDYSIRTERNVIDSDGTLILFESEVTGGTLLTLKQAQKHCRPFLCIDLKQFDDSSVTPPDILNWLQDKNIAVLNVAGPRESTHPGIGQAVESFLLAALKPNFGHA